MSTVPATVSIPTTAAQPAAPVQQPAAPVVAAAAAVVAAPKEKIPFKWLVKTNEQFRNDFLATAKSDGTKAAAAKYGVNLATVYHALRAIGAYQPITRTLPRHSEETLKKAAELLSNGEKANVVAKQLNLSIGMVYGIAKKNSITLRRNNASSDAAKLALVLTELKAGKSAKQVSTDTGVGYAKVLEVARSNNIKFERRGALSVFDRQAGA
jgi:hypothetical protein